MSNLTLVLEWLVIGFLSGLPFCIIFIALYGDRGLNEQIIHLRKNRLKLEKMRLELALRKLILRGRDNGYILSIGVDEKSPNTQPKVEE